MFLQSIFARWGVVGAQGHPKMTPHTTAEYFTEKGNSETRTLSVDRSAQKDPQRRRMMTI